MAGPWGIALGGGGVPGVFAALGFLAALGDLGLSPDVVVGSSSGGLVAGALAAGLPLSEQYDRWSAVAADPWALLPREAWHMLEILRPRATPGLVDVRPVLRRVLSAAAGDVAGWAPGYGVMVSDLTAGRSVLVHAGSPLRAWATEEALAATAGFPGLLAGARDPEGHLDVDGGLYDLVPVAACRRLGAGAVVAVTIGGPAAVPAALTVADVLRLAVRRGLQATDAAANAPAADLKVAVESTGAVLEFSHWRADHAAGAAAAAHAAAAIRAVAAGVP